MTLTGYIWRDWSMAIKINCIPMMITALYPVFLPESPSKDLQSFFIALKNNINKPMESL